MPPEQAVAASGARHADRTERARMFFALWPDPATAQCLHAVARMQQRESGGRLMHLDTLHVTLAFLGDVPRCEIPRLMQIAGRIPVQPFSLQLDQLAGWAHNHIVWAGAGQTPRELERLAERLAQRLGEANFRIEQRPFRPHMTLLRKVARHCEARPIGPFVWEVESFVLVESILSADGSRYRIAGQWPVSDPAN